MKALIIVSVFALIGVSYAADVVKYVVDGQSCEGYIEKEGADAPMILLIHDWDGLTNYEEKRAGMVAAEEYSVFYSDLFGAGFARQRLRIKESAPAC